MIIYVSFGYLVQVFIVSAGVRATLRTLLPQLELLAGFNSETTAVSFRLNSKAVALDERVIALNLMKGNGLLKVARMGINREWYEQPKTGGRPQQAVGLHVFASFCGSLAANVKLIAPIKTYATMPSTGEPISVHCFSQGTIFVHNMKYCACVKVMVHSAGTADLGCFQCEAGRYFRDQVTVTVFTL